MTKEATRFLSEHRFGRISADGFTAYRRGEYFWQAAGTNNTSAPSWFGITVSSGGNSVTGHVLYPKTPETFSYDADGNLTNDLVWVYDSAREIDRIPPFDDNQRVGCCSATGHPSWSISWAEENRLVQMTNVAAVPTVAGRKLDFVYDYMGRRVQKMVSTNSGSAWIPVSTNRFVYDGWNLLAIINPQSSVIQSFMWGLDLSGSMQGAGGVGGLLEVSYHGSSTTNCFAAYDGNGNLTALINAADGTTVANYEYGAFGESIRVSGVMANQNPIRWSTKYTDDESGLVYYGYRSYNSSTGRWLSRDLIGERGGKNLYDFVRNSPVQQIDVHGLSIGSIGPIVYPAGLYCSLCFCKDPTITFNGKPQFNWDIYPVTRDMNLGKAFPGPSLGSAIKVHWDVVGNPKACKYEQNESGTITVQFSEITNPPKWLDPSPTPGYNNKAAQDYTDPLGTVMYNQLLRQKFDLVIVFRCKGFNTVEKRARILANAEAQMPDGPILVNNVSIFQWQ